MGATTIRKAQIRDFAHASTHENGGADELSLAGLAGVLADAQNASHLQGRDLADTAPSDGQALVWSASANRWQPGTVASSSGGYEPLTNGVVASPELVFADGDCIMVPMAD